MWGVFLVDDGSQVIVAVGAQGGLIWKAQAKATANAAGTVTGGYFSTSNGRYWAASNGYVIEALPDRTGRDAAYGTYLTNDINSANSTGAVGAGGGPSGGVGGGGGGPLPKLQLQSAINASACGAHILVDVAALLALMSPGLNLVTALGSLGVIWEENGNIQSDCGITPASVRAVTTPDGNVQCYIDKIQVDCTLIFK